VDKNIAATTKTKPDYRNNQRGQKQLKKKTFLDNPY